MTSIKNSIFYSNSFMDYIGDFLDKEGGIALSSIEKLVDLMKESRDKLVPKCMAITIISLSSPDVQMKLCESGVWNILFQWLQDGLKNDTTCFILEILRLYLTLPISFENLISNSCPKLIKKLTKNGNPDIISISKNIVAKWKKIVEERTVKDIPEVPIKKIKLDENLLKEDKNAEEKKKIRTAKVRNTSFRSAGIEDQEVDSAKVIKKPVKKIEDKPGMEELHQKVSANVDKRKVLEIHESKNFINSIMQTPAPPRKKKKRQESGVNKSASDVSITEETNPDPNLKVSPIPEPILSAEKPKKRVSWAPTDSLQNIKYFELDENERVNVNKVSIEEMKKKERMMERQHASHRFSNDDIDDDTQFEKWYKPLVVLGVPENKIEVTSVEKNIQFERERKVLKVLYFEKDSIPYSPTDPESEPYDVKDPLIIPLEDVTSQKSAVKTGTVASTTDANNKLLIYTEKEGSECHLTLRPDVANLLKSMTQAGGEGAPPSGPPPPAQDGNAEPPSPPPMRVKLIQILRARHPDIDPEKLTSEEVCKLLEPMRDHLIREGILNVGAGPPAPPAFPAPGAPQQPPPPWFNDPRAPHFAPLPPGARMPPMAFPPHPNGGLGPGMPMPPQRHFGLPGPPPRPHMRPLCRFIATSGFCRAGLNCGFSHMMPDGGPRLPQQQQQQFNPNRH